MAVEVAVFFLLPVWLIMLLPGTSAITEQYQGHFYTHLPSYVQSQVHLYLVYWVLGFIQDYPPPPHIFVGECDSSSIINI